MYLKWSNRAMTFISIVNVRLKTRLETLKHGRVRPIPPHSVPLICISWRRKKLTWYHRLAQYPLERPKVFLLPRLPCQHCVKHLSLEMARKMESMQPCIQGSLEESHPVGATRRQLLLSQLLLTLVQHWASEAWFTGTGSPLHFSVLLYF